MVRSSLSDTLWLCLFSQYTFAEHLLYAKSTLGPVTESRVRPTLPIQITAILFLSQGGGQEAKGPGTHSVETVLDTCIHCHLFVTAPGPPRAQGLVRWRGGHVRRASLCRKQQPCRAAGGKFSEGRPAGVDRWPGSAQGIKEVSVQGKQRERETRNGNESQRKNKVAQIHDRYCETDMVSAPRLCPRTRRDKRSRGSG